MKIAKLILSIMFSALLFASCENGEHNTLPTKPEEAECYIGTLTVDQNDGTTYTQEDVKIDYEIIDGKLNFVMYKVKFSENMPIKLDMVVEGIDCLGVVGNYVLAGNGIVPYAMGGKFEKYTITELIGAITHGTMSLSFTCGDYPVTYEGRK